MSADARPTPETEKTPKEKAWWAWAKDVASVDVEVTLWMKHAYLDGWDARDSEMEKLERERDEAREALAKLAPIGARIATQDNRCTSLPVFMVEQKRRIWGMEEGDDYEWLETGEWIAASDDEVEDLEEHLLIYGEEKKGFTRRYYTDIWEFCTACFTEQGCKDYLAANGHNLNEPRIYVHSGYRNSEWELIRDVIKQTAREGGV
jgi:hypothetical protein